MLTRKQRKRIKSDAAQRLLQSGDLLAGELLRRGFLEPADKHDVRQAAPGATERTERQSRITGALFAAELANADRQLAARAILRGTASPSELRSLHILLKFQPRSDKLGELIRIVERELEGKRYGDRR